MIETVAIYEDMSGTKITSTSILEKQKRSQKDVDNDDRNKVDKVFPKLPAEEAEILVPEEKYVWDATSESLVSVVFKQY